MSDTTPSGANDLISDVEEHIAKQEADLAREKKRLEAMRGGTVVLDEDGNEVTPSTSTEIAVTEDGRRELEWPHKEIVFKGETFNVRKPQPQALAAFSIISSKYMPEETQRDMLGLFLKNHLSPMSMERFAYRMFDPDDAEFDASSMGEMFRLIATVGTNRPTGPSRG